MTISEKQKQEIREEAKKILDDFSKKLEKIDTKEEPVIEREECERNEEREKQPYLNKDTMFENAPNSNKDFIIAEKGGW